MFIYHTHPVNLVFMTVVKYLELLIGGAVYMYIWDCSVVPRIENRWRTMYIIEFGVYKNIVYYIKIMQPGTNQYWKLYNFQLK